MGGAAEDATKNIVCFSEKTLFKQPNCCVSLTDKLGNHRISIIIYHCDIHHDHHDHHVYRDSMGKYIGNMGKYRHGKIWESHFSICSVFSLGDGLLIAKSTELR